MKEATGELNMTVIVIIAAVAILLFLNFMLEDMFKEIRERWGGRKEPNVPISMISNYEALSINLPLYIESID
ncbi:MAG: hypothetical protein ACOXZW_02365 [Bacilli bacterium]|jgi:hypothetical protein|nr:hypothetical protein [Bacilli bacterium]